MKKDAITSLGVSDEIAEQIVSLVNAELKDHVPKSRLDNAVEQRDSYKNDYENLNKQLDELKNSVKDVEGLKSEITKLQETNKQLISDHEAKISKMTLESTVDIALLKADAKNPIAVKALMSDFLANATVENDVVKGLDDAIAKVKESDGYLFNTVSSKNPTGHTPKSGSGNEPQTPRSVFEARLAEAKNSNNQIEAIKVKQEAAAQGISLL